MCDSYKLSVLTFIQTAHWSPAALMVPAKATSSDGSFDSLQSKWQITYGAHYLDYFHLPTLSASLTSSPGSPFQDVSGLINVISVVTDICSILHSVGYLLPSSLPQPVQVEPMLVLVSSDINVFVRQVNTSTSPSDDFGRWRSGTYCAFWSNLHPEGQSLHPVWTQASPAISWP